MNRTSLLLVLVLVLPALLGGCTIAMPFDGPMIDPDTGRLRADATSDGQVIVAITNAVVAPAYRDVFDAQTDAVVEDLKTRDGMLGFSLRGELFGAEVWTQTMWASEEDMLSFVVGDTHSNGMITALNDGWFESARFVHVDVAVADAPLSWERVEEELNSPTSTY